MHIQPDCVALFHYTLSNEKGEVLDSSDGREPLAYIHGAGNIVAGLERAMAGHRAGDAFEVLVAPEDGYGTRDAGLIQDVPRSAFRGINKIEPGMTFQAQGPQGPRPVVVTKVAKDTVTVDGNHPLAGQTLHFKISVTEVRDATDEEKQHGHVHGPGGHHH